VREFLNQPPGRDKRTPRGRAGQVEAQHCALHHRQRGRRQVIKSASKREAVATRLLIGTNDSIDSKLILPEYADNKCET